MQGLPKKVLFFQSECTDPYKNIAFEYGLLQACPKDAVAVYLWQNDHSVIIGKNQNAWSEVHVAEFLADGGRIARRFSGGGAVYHDLKNLNFSFVAPKGIYDKAVNFQVIIRALATLGINAELTGRNDLVVDGKKISGNAFKNERHASLHHGTLLIDVDVAKMQKYLNVSKEKLATKGVKSVSSRVVNLKTFKPDLTAERLAQAIRRVCGEVFNAPCVDGREEDFAWDGQRRTAELLRSAEWIFGRVADEDFCVVSKRFDWGGVELAYKAQGDVIKDLLLFSDSLDERLGQLAVDNFVGKSFSQIASRAFDHQQLQDVANLLLQNYKPLTA